MAYEKLEKTYKYWDVEFILQTNMGRIHNNMN